jgi:hypothetical protein
MEVQIASMSDVKVENHQLQLNFILYNYSVTLVCNISRLKPKNPSSNEIRLPYKMFQVNYIFIVRVGTGLLKMIVVVLTTCHTQYT